jgi:hypothetical protein
VDAGGQLGRNIFCARNGQFGAAPQGLSSPGRFAVFAIYQSHSLQWPGLRPLPIHGNASKGIAKKMLLLILSAESGAHIPMLHWTN